MTDQQTYSGSCHCGRVRFEFQANIASAMECNCSLCRRKGALWHAASDTALRIVSGEEELTLYQFGTMTAKHYSCRHCGVSPLTRPRLDPTRWAVNLRCIEGLDLSLLAIRKFDGKHWEAAAKAIRARAE